MKNRIIASLVFLLLGATSLANDNSYIAKMISCTEEEEGFILSQYSAYLTLLEKKYFEAGELSVHESVVTRNDRYTRLSWSFYVTPNELTGFEISIPNELLKVNENIWTNQFTLEIESRSHKQGHDLFVLKKIEDSNKTAETTRASARVSP